MRWPVVLTAAGAVAYWLLFTPVAVREHEVSQGPIVAEVMGTGTLEARVKTTVSPKIGGRINRIGVDLGDRVRAGQELIRLDDADLQQQVEIAQATHAAAEAAVRRLQADQQSAVAVLQQARREHARSQKLALRQAVTEAETDRTQEALGVAEAGLARAEAAVAEAQRQVSAAQETLQYHRARLSDTVVVAPYDGLIVRRQRDPGDVLVPGSPVLNLISTEVLWITAWIDETQMARVAVGQPARVVFRSEPNRSYPGQVARLGRETDRETREFTVDVTVLELPAHWATGQRAEVFIETGRKAAAVLLPAQFVVWRDGQPGTFVNAGGWAVWHRLELGIHAGQTLEVLDGLEPGQRAVEPIDPQTSLRPGLRVVGETRD